MPLLFWYSACSACEHICGCMEDMAAEVEELEVSDPVKDASSDEGLLICFAILAFTQFCLQSNHAIIMTLGDL